LVKRYVQSGPAIDSQQPFVVFGAPPSVIGVASRRVFAWGNACVGSPA